MSNLAIRVLPEPIRSLGFASFSGSSYVGIGASFVNPIHSYKINNNTDVDVMISWDGINDHEFVPAHSGFVNDVASNKSINAGTLEVARGTRFYVRDISGAPTMGAVYISVFYGFGG